MASLLLMLAVAGWASAQSVTSSDLFLMPGSDLARPGWLPRANLNVGAGHTFSRLHPSPAGDELTFAYTYENAGSHGFWHTSYGAHTESLGVMRNFTISKSVSMYGWQQLGVTSYTGGRKVLNRLYFGTSAGVAIHLSSHHGVWLQETYNKVATAPWWLSTNIGYTYSF